MTSLVNWFLIWWLRSGRYPWSRFRRKYFEFFWRNTALPSVTSLDDVLNRLGDVKWTRDKFLHLWDSVSYPQTVWRSKKDDCDGFAVLAAALLRQSQPDSDPVLVTAMLRPVKYSHTVCAFQAPEGGLWFFDNYYLRQGNYHTYDDIVEVVKGDHELICWDVADPVKLATMEFHAVV